MAMQKTSIFCLIVLLLIGSVTSVTGDVEYVGRRIVAKGQSFSIECRLSLIDVPKWTKDGVPLPSQSGFHLSEERLDNNEVRLRLYVEKAQTDHQGDYRCKSTSRRSHRLALVDDLGHHSEKAANSMVIRENETLQLVCNLPRNGAFSVKWFKQNRQLLPSDEPGLEMEGDKLTILRAQESDAGEYMCTTANVSTFSKPAVSGPDDIIGQITLVKFPAKVEAFSGRISVQAGFDLLLDCRVRGSPIPIVTWFIGKTKASDVNDSRIELRDNDDGLPGAILFINNLTFSDRNLYTCKAENSASSDEASVTMIVRAVGAEEGQEPPKTAYVPKGGKFTLTCHVPLSGLHLWFKDGVPIAPNALNQYRLEQDPPRRGLGPQAQEHFVVMRLWVESADPMHSGEYKCSSFSPHSHRIRVLTGHEIDTNADENGSVIMHLEKPLVLQCNVTIVAEPNLVWFHQGVKITEENSPHVKITAADNTLRIDKPKEDRDVGRWECVTSFDEKPLNATINVLSMVRIEPFHKSLNLVQGDKLVLTCKTKGYPPPTITWFKDSENLMTTNASDGKIKFETDNNIKAAKLIIEKLEYEDKAYYTCEAHSHINTENSTILVRVKDKLAALWPFLGICAEVAILCTIIFVYEKKRVKPDFDESDTDQNTENKNVQDQKEGGQDVRQRK